MFLYCEYLLLFHNISKRHILCFTDRGRIWEWHIKWLFGTSTCNMSSSTRNARNTLFVSQLQLHCFEYLIVHVVWILTLHRQNNTEKCRHLKEKRHRGDWQHAYTYCHKHLSNRAAEWHQHKGWHGWINLLFQRRIRKRQILETVSWQKPISSKPSTPTTDLFDWILTLPIHKHQIVI